jgi:hypothetical protein
VVVTARLGRELAGWVAAAWGLPGEGWGRAFERMALAVQARCEGRGADLPEVQESVAIVKMETEAAGKKGRGA